MFVKLVRLLHLEADIEDENENALTGYSSGMAEQQQMDVNHVRGKITQLYNTANKETPGRTANNSWNYGEIGTVADYHRAAICECNIVVQMRLDNY